MNNGKKPQKYYFAWDEKQKTKKLSEKLRIKIFEDGKLEECGQMVANHSYNGIEDSQDMFISNPK